MQEDLFIKSFPLIMFALGASFGSALFCLWTLFRFKDQWRRKQSAENPDTVLVAVKMEPGYGNGVYARVNWTVEGYAAPFHHGWVFVDFLFMTKTEADREGYRDAGITITLVAAGIKLRSTRPSDV